MDIPSPGVFPGMTSSQDIVVTGVGVVSPIGIGREPFWTALCEGRSGIRRLPLFDDPQLPSPWRRGKQLDPKQYVRPRKSLKVEPRYPVGLRCGRHGVHRRRLRESPLNPDRLGVMLGADMIPPNR